MNKPLRIALASAGAIGDIEPYLALAQELQRRGHTVRLCSNDMHQPRVSSQGIEFVAASWDCSVERLVAGLQGLSAPGRERVFNAGFVPYPELFRMARCVVHYAGPGTTYETVKAGVPSVPVPRLHRLGVASRPLPRVNLSPRRLRRRIQAVLSPKFRLGAATLAEQAAEERGTARAVELLEDFARLGRDGVSAGRVLQNLI